MNKPNYELSSNQEVFVEMLEEEGLGPDIYYDYSGRCMYGTICPAINLDSLSEFPGNPHNFNVDQMGRGYVVYASR